MTMSGTPGPVPKCTFKLHALRRNWHFRIFLFLPDGKRCETLQTQAGKVIRLTIFKIVCSVCISHPHKHSNKVVALNPTIISYSVIVNILLLKFSIPIGSVSLLWMYYANSQRQHREWIQNEIISFRFRSDCLALFCILYADDCATAATRFAGEFY